MVALSGEEYYMSFIDIVMQFTMVMFLKKKSDILTLFKDYHTFIETQMGNKIKRLCSDNGREYVGDEFKIYCKSHSIQLEYMAPHSPHHNRIVE